MKRFKLIKRTLSLVSVIAMVITSLLVGGISAAALSSCARNFNDGTYSSNPGDYVANIAVAQLGRNQPSFGYDAPWCAAFVSDCAAKAGQSAAVPWNGSVVNLYNAILNAGGALVSSPKNGDIYITKSFGHTAVFVDGGSNIVDGNNIWTNPTSTRKYSPNYSGGPAYYILRPRYTGTVVTPPSVSTGNAANVTNYTAKISASVSNGTASSYGFYFGTSQSSLPYKSGTSGSSTMDIATYISSTFGQLKANTTYYYKAYAIIGGREIAASNVKYFTTTNIKPSVVTPKVSAQDIAIGDSIQVTWTAANNATYYEVCLYDESGELVETNDSITGTSTAFSGRSAGGIFYVGLKSFNNAGTAGESARVKVTVHDNVKVDFVDYDGTKLRETQLIGYGKSATAPADPERKGYTFDSWDKSFNALTEDTVIKATYTINVYTVRFFDNSGKMIGTPQRVEYQSAATEPPYTPADGYKLFGWDKDFDCIEEDTDITANIDWYNENFDVFAKLISAERVAEGENNEGYDVTVNVINNEETTTRGRVVVALQTSEGNLVEMTESAAFAVKKASTKEVNVFVPSDKVATKVTVYVVSSYSSIIPIADPVSMEIDQSNAWTEWSTEEPPEDAYKTESKTEYSYSTKTTTTSYDTSLSGWTQAGSTWVKSGSGYTDYITNWPSGFSTSHWIYNSYHKSAPYAYETATNKRDVSTSTIGYMYYHWCRGDNVGCTLNRMISYNWTSQFNTFHAFISSGAIGYDAQADAFAYPNSSACNSTKWWNSANPNSIPVYRTNYTDYKKQFTYYKWSEYSDWSTTVKNPDDNTKVNVRTLYRYRTNEAAAENLEGIEHTVEGNIGEENAGKKASLYVYKVNSASDFTNEFVGQTTIGENGDYSFAFKLREEPTAETGDFTVELGLEGASTGIYLDSLLAPKKTYTVNFFNKNGEVISTQEVEEGEDATLPSDSLMKEEGYRFLNWTESNRNIREDLDIYPNYERQEFTVVFVDWSSRDVKMEKYKYGEVLTLPVLGDIGDGQEIKWDCEPGTVVKEDMIVTTVVEQKMVSATIMDDDNSVIKTVEIPYGTAISLPTLSNVSKTLVGWKIQMSDDAQVYDLYDSVLTSNATIYPVCVYSESVVEPQCSLSEGEYVEAQTIELTCEDTEAQIYYTIDGTNPLDSETAILYNGKFTIDSGCELQFASKKEGLNDSEVVRRLFAINTAGNKAYHITYITVCYDGNGCGEYTLSNLVEDGTTVDSMNIESMCEGYDLTGLYYDIERQDQVDIHSAKIQSTSNLYAFYKIKVFDVIFKAEDGTIYKSERVNYKQSATAPIPDEKEGFVFVGWNTDKYLEVTSDLIVTAVFVSDIQFDSEYVTISFQDEDGTVYKNEIVKIGGSATPPMVYKEGYVFTGWDSDGYINAAIDLIVVAQFKIDESSVLSGDANSDGVVNMKDVLILRKHVAGMPVELNFVASDIDGEGAVNMKDVLMLRKYLAE